MAAKRLFKILIVVVLVLFAIVLSIIAVNGIYRCYHSPTSFFKSFGSSSSNDFLAVDLYAPDLNSIPQNASSGMTMLVDLGIFDLDTGVYILSNKNNQPPLKLKVPEVGEKYKITKGQYAGYIHTIRPSFAEIKGPTETLIISNKNENEEHIITKEIKKVVILDSVSTQISLHIAEDIIGLKEGFLKLKIVNLSLLKDVQIMHMSNETFLKPKYVGNIYFTTANNGEIIFSS